MSRLARWVTILAMMVSILAATAGSEDCPPSAMPEEAPSEEEWEALAEKAYAARGIGPPEGHPLAAIVEGMSIIDVQSRLGIPDDVATYETGKGWIPFAGADAVRTEWRYSGVGRVIFSRETDLSAGYVSRVDFNPEETGTRWENARCGRPDEDADAFARVRPGMLEVAVRALLGHPDRAERWETGKRFVPFYFGPDLIRVEWTYEGLGTVRFFYGSERYHMHVLSASRVPGAARVGEH